MHIDNTYISARELFGNVIKARINGEKVKESWEKTGEISDLLADYYNGGDSKSYTLNMIINEVLENAVKYSSTLSVIDLLAYKKNNKVVFSITNELGLEQWNNFRNYIENKNTDIRIKDYAEKLYSHANRYNVHGGLGLLLLMQDENVDLDFTFYKSITSCHMVFTKVSIDLSA